MSKNVKNTRSGSRFFKRYGNLILILLVAVVAILELTNTTYIFHKQKPIAQSGNAETKGGVDTSSTTGSQSSGQSTSNDNTGQPGDVKHQGDSADPNANLVAPWGEFANVYQAGVNTQMGSTCNTTPGATCQIIFTNGAVSKYLSSQTTDRGGAAFWAWKPSQIGLTTGTWHIMAKAVLGSQSKTTSNDPLTLEITK